MYEYDFYTVHTDTIGSTTKNEWTSMLFQPIHNVVQVSIVSASIDIGTLGAGKEVVYLNVDQFHSPFNDVAGKPGDQETPGIVSSVQTKDKLRHSMAQFLVTPSVNRIVFKGGDYSTQTQFKVPIDTVDRLTQRLYDQDGNPITIAPTANNFITYRITSLKLKSEV